MSDVFDRYLRSEPEATDDELREGPFVVRERASRRPKFTPWVWSSRNPNPTVYGSEFESDYLIIDSRVSYTATGTVAIAFDPDTAELIRDALNDVEDM